MLFEGVPAACGERAAMARELLGGDLDRVGRRPLVVGVSVGRRRRRAEADRAAVAVPDLLAAALAARDRRCRARRPRLGRHRRALRRAARRDRPGGGGAVVERPAGGAHEAGGHAVVLTAPAAVRDGLDMWGPVPGLELMRRVKQQFDPDGRFAPGRFVGGI